MVKLENVFDLIAQQDTLETVGPVVDTKNVRVEVIRYNAKNRRINPEEVIFDNEAIFTYLMDNDLSMRRAFSSPNFAVYL